jgi:hypothetical protein
VLKNNLRAAYFNTFAAVCAFFFDYNHSAVFALVNRLFGADFFAFTALDTDARFVSAGLREKRFNTEGRFFRVDFIEMVNGAYLQAEAAASAIR